MLGGHPVINFEIAHIRDANVGNRYDPAMTDDDRRHFRNLVLLCDAHHKLVDKVDPNAYPWTVLEAWKLAADPNSAGQLDEVDETDLKEAITNVTVDLGGGVLYLGGQGGHWGGGGGGGGVIGSGRGGDGGPGGGPIVVDDNTRIVLEGQGARAPGGGGGGGGSLAPGSIVRRQSSADERSTGEAGQLGLSSILLCNYAETRDSLLYVAGGGWEWVSALNLGDSFSLPVAILLECGGMEAGDYRVSVRMLTPEGECVEEADLTFALAERAPVRRVVVFHTFQAKAEAFGKWELVVHADGWRIGGLHFLVKRTGEA